jgi:hypothetical protein
MLIKYQLVVYSHLTDKENSSTAKKRESTKEINSLSNVGAETTRSAVKFKVCGRYFGGIFKHKMLCL